MLRTDLSTDLSRLTASESSAVLPFTRLTHNCDHCWHDGEASIKNTSSTYTADQHGIQCVVPMARPFFRNHSEASLRGFWMLRYMEMEIFGNIRFSRPSASWALAALLDNTGNVTPRVLLHLYIGQIPTLWSIGHTVARTGTRSSRRLVPYVCHLGC